MCNIENTIGKKNVIIYIYIYIYIVYQHLLKDKKHMYYVSK